MMLKSVKINKEIKKIVEPMHTISHFSPENTETFMFAPMPSSQRVKTTSLEEYMRTKQSNTLGAHRRGITNMETNQTTSCQDPHVNTYHIAQDPDAEDIQNDPELAFLALQLRPSSPAVAIDPEFRATLRGKIQDLVQCGQPCSSSTLSSSQKSSKHMAEVNEEDFSYIAHNIVKLPEKERKAILIDLVKQTRSDTSKCPIQKALSDLGIQLDEYRELPQFDKNTVIHAYHHLKSFLFSEKSDNITKNR
jgi:hypothetical protein